MRCGSSENSLKAKVMNSPTSAPPRNCEEPVFDDPIVKEVRRDRHELAGKCGNDLQQIATDLIKRQALLGHRLRLLPEDTALRM
jgi:hypothetical protein